MSLQEYRQLIRQRLLTIEMANVELHQALLGHEVVLPAPEANVDQLMGDVEIDYWNLLKRIVQEARLLQGSDFVFDGPAVLAKLTKIVEDHNAERAPMSRLGTQRKMP